MQLAREAVREKEPARIGRIGRIRLGWGWLWGTLMALAFSLFVLIPFAWVVFTSVKSQKELSHNPLGLPAKWQWDNFIEAWTRATLVLTLSQHHRRYTNRRTGTHMLHPGCLCLLASKVSGQELAVYHFSGGTHHPSQHSHYTPFLRPADLGPAEYLLGLDPASGGQDASLRHPAPAQFYGGFSRGNPGCCKN